MAEEFESSPFNQTNIKFFITEKSKPYYNKVINIVENFENFINESNPPKPGYWSLKTKCNIFGGFIRNIIEHYFEFQEKPDSEFRTPKDIDVWFNKFHINENMERSYCHSETTWNRDIKLLVDKLNEKYYPTKHPIISYPDICARINYGVKLVNIENIDFDLCTEINWFQTFNCLCDYTCNNLYIDIKGNLNYKTNTKYSISDSIYHIQKRLLIKITDLEFINRMKDIDEFSEEYYQEKDEKREKKMLSYGYNY